mgnify:CR=1 FL=1
MADEVTSGAEASGAGMPQLEFSTFPNQIFWLVVALVVIYVLLSRVALPRIAGVMAERQGTITNDHAAAEDLKRHAAAAGLNGAHTSGHQEYLENLVNRSLK